MVSQSTILSVPILPTTVLRAFKICKTQSKTTHGTKSLDCLHLHLFYFCHPVPTMHLKGPAVNVISFDTAYCVVKDARLHVGEDAKKSHLQFVGRSPLFWSFTADGCQISFLLSRDRIGGVMVV